MVPHKLARWLGAGALGTLMVLGCRHARRAPVICCDCCEYVTPVAADPVPPPQPKPMAKVLPPPTTEVVAVKKDERPNVAYRVVAPGMSAGSGDIVGTDEMTAADADKVHIRPGYTPGALYLSGRTAEPPVQTVGEKKVEPSEPSENPSVPHMDVPQRPVDGTVPPIEIPQKPPQDAPVPSDRPE